LTPETLRPLGLTIVGQSDRTAVILLHGFMGSKSEWASVMDELARGFTCVAVDLPGHGSSLGLPDATYTIDGAARAVLGALDGVEIRRATIVGYSMGGRLALYLALRHPERCSGLFLESASPGIEDAAGRRARRGADEEKARRLESGDFEGFLEDWYRQPLFAPLARDGALLRRTIGARRRSDPAELARSLRGMGTGSQPSLWEELPGLRVPALAVAGELDEKFVGISRRMERLSQRVRAAIVPDAGHDVHDEAPGAYLALLRRYLDGLSSASAG
jgi:2-succinyl-6-hydroxy-2,4-cyclohexadiene-1-carboxylate synthase